MKKTVLLFLLVLSVTALVGCGNTKEQSNVQSKKFTIVTSFYPLYLSTINITKDIPNVEVDAFDGLLNEYAAKKNCHLLIRGLRAFSDFEYEFQRALMIKKIDPTLETAFFMTDGRYSYLSSTGVRELAHFNGDVTSMVPPFVQEMIKRKVNSIKK